MNLPNAGKRPIKILFVCMGNICRSPAAHGVMEHLVKSKSLEYEILIDSAGTYAGHAGQFPDQRMRVHARQRGYELTHRSRPFVSADFDDFDMIFGMDSSNIANLNGKANTLSDMKKIIPFASLFRNHPHYDHVPDPYYDSADGFEIVLDLVEDACLHLMDILEENAPKYKPMDPFF